MIADPFRFEPDIAGIELLTRGPAVAPIIASALWDAQRRMKALAAGMHRSSFFDFPASISAIAPKLVDGVMTGYVGSNSPGWHLQEFGTSSQAPRAVIRRALNQTPAIRFDEGA